MINSFVDRLKTYRWNKDQGSEWGLFFLTLIGGLFIGLLIRDAPLLGIDWFHAYWRLNMIAYFHPPWTSWVVYPLAMLPWRLGFNLSLGISLAAIGVLTYREGKDAWRYVGVMMAIFSVPTLVLMWGGQIDGWALLGFLILPWGVPLLIVKPTLISFALLARKEWIIGGVIFGGLSLLIWGWWPQSLIETIPGRLGHPAAVGWEIVGWPLAVFGLLLFLFSNRSDPFHLIAAGSFLMPFLLTYHFVSLLPILGRTTRIKQLGLWLASWLLILPFAIGGPWRFLAYLFPLAVWIVIKTDGNPQETWYSWGMGQLKRLRRVKSLG